MVGNSSGSPPASQTPRLTASATSRRCALQLVSSLHELQMPITGRSPNTSLEKPCAPVQERLTKLFRVTPLNQFWLRSFMAPSLLHNAIFLKKLAGAVPRDDHTAVVVGADQVAVVYRHTADLDGTRIAITSQRPFESAGVRP